MRNNNIIIQCFVKHLQSLFAENQRRHFKSSYRRTIIVQLLTSRNSKGQSLNFLSITLQLQLSLILQCDCMQRYTYRVLQTIQIKLILLCVWAERAVLGNAKTALEFKYEI